MWRLRNFVVGTLTMRGARALVYVTFLVLAVITTAVTARAIFVNLIASPSSPLIAALRVEQGQMARSSAAAGHVTLNQDEWHERIKSKDFWRDRGSREPAIYRPDTKPSSMFPFQDGFGPMLDGAVRRPSDGTFRTVCVRLCDGYYFPVSFSTTEGNFDRDQATCSNSCGSPARLYVAPSSSDDVSELRSVDGQPYSKLPTALLYRTKYDAQCRCTPQPWDKEALDRHRIYALEEAQRRGNREAREELASFKRKLESDRRRLAEQRTLALTSLRAGGVLARSGPLDAASAGLPAPHKSPPVPKPEVRILAGATPPATETAIMRLGVMPQKANANTPMDEPGEKPRSRNRRSR